jgi:hypothetical protein
MTVLAHLRIFNYITYKFYPGTNIALFHLIFHAKFGLLHIVDNCNSSYSEGKQLLHNSLHMSQKYTT